VNILDRNDQDVKSDAYHHRYEWRL